MDNTFFNYPLEPILRALRTLIGRMLFFLLVICLGCGLGGWTSTGEFIGFFIGFVGMPYIFLFGAYYSVGILVNPLSVAILIAAIRLELKEYVFLAPLLLFWWMAHDYLDFRVNEKENIYMNGVLESIADLYANE